MNRRKTYSAFPIMRSFTWQVQTFVRAVLLYPPFTDLSIEKAWNFFT
jgi:hypothetical protein